MNSFRCSVKSKNHRITIKNNSCCKFCGGLDVKYSQGQVGEKAKGSFLKFVGLTEGFKGGETSTPFLILTDNRYLER